MQIEKTEIGMIEELEAELIQASAELAAACLKPLTGRTAARIVTLTARITETVARTL